MAKVKPESVVKPVRPEGAKNCKWYVKGEEGFERASFARAYELVRETGLKCADALNLLNELKAQPFTTVKERKNGQLVFAR